jgi:hypothetical protein
MQEETLEDLREAYEEWRSKKKHTREGIPEELIERARRVAREHGRWRVARRMGIDSRRLARRPGEERGERAIAAGPTYSRIELVGAAIGGPFAELEMPSGIKVRLYEQTEEALGLLSAVCVVGGGR